MSGMQIQWASLADFWAMGGYGLYVWGSFGVTGGVLLAEVLALWRRRRALRSSRPRATPSAGS